MIENGTIYISCSEAAQQWGISARRVRTLCVQGLISGAQRVGKLWKIPQNAPKPADGRHQPREGVPSVLRGAIAEVDAQDVFLRTLFLCKRGTCPSALSMKIAALIMTHLRHIIKIRTLSQCYES